MEMYQQPAIAAWSRYLVNSYRQWVGTDLVPPTEDDYHRAQCLFKTSFVVVSYGRQSLSIGMNGRLCWLSLGLI